jgi:LruC domain-containing protein
MKIMKPLPIIIGIFLLIFIACSDDVIFDETEVETQVEVVESAIQKLNIPEGFDFRTQQKVDITIIDNENYAKYDVYGYSEEMYFAGDETFENESGEIVTEPIYKSDVLSKLIFTGVPHNGVLKQSFNLPTYYDKVYIRRNDNLKFSSSIVNIVNQEVNYTYSTTFGKANNTIAGKAFGPVVNDYLYCVNGSAELFQVDPLTGELTYLSDMPMGSWTCAIDQENKVLYSIGRSSPYPLMKYSIQNGTWEIIANIGRGGPRLDYNSQDNLLYFSTGNKLYTYNTNGVNINTWNIIGLHNSSGGDLAIDDNGNLFLCTFSGLYSLELDANNDYQSTRISADNLPFQPTSMTFDSNNELWLSNNAESSDLIIMDTQTGGWQYNYGINADNNTNYGRTINDLTTFRVYSEIAVETDTDGDGILDRDDSYPEDSNKAFELFTPSKYGWGTVAFEDLWPSNGDYDFNDLAVNYRIIAILNAQNLAVQLDFIINIKSNRAGFTNGFGIEIESLLPSQITSVSGNILKHNFIGQNANGTESGQEKAVIILFDDPNSMVNQETTISVNFNQPISTNNLGTAPFNPFLIVNKIREKEVHLAGFPATSKGSKNIQINGLNSDEDGNYFNEVGLPWAIDIVHDFKVPKERIPVTEAYNFFTQWATSGGSQYKDWYKDNPGYRNIEKIEP